MIGEVIYGLLSGITSNIFPLLASQKTRVPYITYNSNINNPSDTKQGPSTLDVVRVQIDIWATDYETCNNMFDLVRRQLDRYRGIVGTVNVDSIQFIGENDVYDDESEFAHHSSDWSIRVIRTP